MALTFEIFCSTVVTNCPHGISDFNACFHNDSFCIFYNYFDHLMASSIEIISIRLYHTCRNFRGVEIFVDFVVCSLPTKINPLKVSI